MSLSRVVLALNGGVCVLAGASRRLVWRLDCWMAIVSSFDDPHVRLAPEVLAVSQTILDAAGAEMLAHCGD